MQNNVLFIFFNGSAPVDSHSPLKLGNITSMHNLTASFKLIHYIYIYTQTWILSAPHSMIKNKAAFTISKKINRLYREEKTKTKQAMNRCCLADFVL